VRPPFRDGGRTFNCRAFADNRLGARAHRTRDRCRSYQANREATTCGGRAIAREPSGTVIPRRVPRRVVPSRRSSRPLEVDARLADLAPHDAAWLAPVVQHVPHVRSETSSAVFKIKRVGSGLRTRSPLRSIARVSRLLVSRRAAGRLLSGRRATPFDRPSFVGPRRPSARGPCWMLRWYMRKVVALQDRGLSACRKRVVGAASAEMSTLPRPRTTAGTGKTRPEGRSLHMVEHGRRPGTALAAGVKALAP